MFSNEMLCEVTPSVTEDQPPTNKTENLRGEREDDEGPSSTTPKNMDFCRILSEDIEVYYKFNVIVKKVLLQLLPPNIVFDVVGFIEKAMREFVGNLFKYVECSDFVSIKIYNSSWDVDKPAVIPFKQKNQLLPDVIMNVLQKIAQLDPSFKMPSKLYFNIQIVQIPVGFGGEKRKPHHINTVTKLKRSIISVPGNTMCLPRAIVIAMAKIEKNTKITRNIKESNKILKAQTENLMKRGNIEPSGGGGGIPELEKYQELLAPEYQIIAYNDLQKDSIIFKGCIHSYKRIYLLYQNNHFDVITNIAGALGVERLCPACNKCYKRRAIHICTETCQTCFSVPPCFADDEKNIHCEKCNRYFTSRRCYDNHERIQFNNKTACELQKICTTCNQIMGRRHECFKHFCKNCKMNKETGHMCYLTPLKTRNLSNSQCLYMFFNIQTQYLYRKDGNVSNQHMVLCAVQQCYECEDKEDSSSDCLHCGRREHTFTGPNCITSFFNFLRFNKKKIYAIAHGLHHEYGERLVFQTSLWAPKKIIMHGSEIASIEAEHITFLDSMLFMDTEFRNLSKMFNIPREDDMFNYDDYTTSCCMQDTNILRLACREFRKLLLEVGGIDVFRESVTMNSGCTRIFRKNFLKPETIGIIPKSGYRMSGNYSKEGIKWLLFESRSRGIEIQHAGNGREAYLPGFGKNRMDGISKPTSGEAVKLFEYNGCYWHGHNCFLTQHEYQKENKRAVMESRYKNTMIRLESLRKEGYIVNTMWACEFKNFLRNNPHLDKELDEELTAYSNPIDIYETLREGRAEAFVSYYKVKEGEEIRYRKINNLFPYILKYNAFPIDHPKILVGDKCPATEKLLEMSGVARVKILPPKTLRHPILPYNVGKKMLFSLCRSCAESLKPGYCNHENPEDRAMTSTWVLEELKKACEKGYTIMKIYEVWVYDTTQYNNAENIPGGLFNKYIDVFLKLKLEASGFPLFCISENDKEKYVQYIKEKEGINIDVSKIAYNKNLLKFAQQCLDNVWESLCQNNKPVISIGRGRKELLKLFTSSEIILHRLLLSIDNAAFVSWKHKDNRIISQNSMSVVIAAYVTTAARLKLYEYLEDLGDRILYCNTDSVIYVKNDVKDIPTGDILGTMTDELERYGKGSFGTEFFSCDPDTYVLKVRSPSGSVSTVCKVKDVSLNSDAIEFDSMRRLLQEFFCGAGQGVGEVDIPKPLQFGCSRVARAYDVSHVCERNRS